MLTIIGATGNVGSSTVSALRKAGAPVRVVLHDREKREPFDASGCEVVIVDLQKTARLADAIAGSSAVQIVVPLRPSATDPVMDMRASVVALFTALSVVRPPRVLAISDYGAHVDEDIGMPSIFHDLEHRLEKLECRKTFLRSAEHMHNLARLIPTTLASGVLPTFQDPVDQAQPMIAAQDLGRIAADLLLRDQGTELAVVHAEGPKRYSADDAAVALSELSGRTIRAQAAPRTAWREILERNMPPSLAALMARTNDAKNAGGLVDRQQDVGEVRFGDTSLLDALRPLMPRGDGPARP